MDPADLLAVDHFDFGGFAGDNALAGQEVADTWMDLAAGFLPEPQFIPVVIAGPDGLGDHWGQSDLWHDMLQQDA